MRLTVGVLKFDEMKSDLIAYVIAWCRVALFLGLFPPQ